MAYDEALAQRVRTILASMPDVVEKKMFGGVGFLLRGNMACGVNKDDLVVRVGAERYEQLLGQPHVRLFDMTGRPMKGWIVVTPEGVAGEKELGYWVQEGVRFAQSLPPK